MALAFVVTGFSSFPGCSANPTELLVRSLEAKLKQRGVDAVICTVLRVSGKEVDTWCAEQAQVLPKNRPIIWVHFGVDVKGEYCKLEVQAYNEATFRECDTDGWQPCQKPIDLAHGCTAQTCLHTRLPMQKVLGKLKAAGHSVELSESAGRYLCNYIYFRSLLNCTSIPNWHALFVHLPPLKSIGEEQQLALALDLFDALRADFQLQQVQSVQHKVAVTE